MDFFYNKILKITFFQKNTSLLLLNLYLILSIKKTKLFENIKVV